MSFLHPEFLYYMLPPLFILFGLLLTQKESQALFFSKEVMDRLRVSKNSLTLKARNALFFMVGIFLIIALAEPVIKEGKVQVSAKSSDIMIALDISDSMLASDVYPNRIDLAKQKALEFLKLSKKDRVGVIGFAKNSYLVSPLSFDKSVVGFLLKNLNTKSITEKGTDFSNMLDVVENTLSKENKKIVLILSDGGDNDDFAKEIAFAKDKNIVVFVLGLGTKKGAPVKLDNGEFITKDNKIIVTKLNDNVSKLATSTGGVYIQNTTSNEDINAMFEEIQKVSVKKELKSREVERMTPLFYYPLAIAMILLLVAISSISKRKNPNIIPVFALLALLFVNTHVDAGVLDFMQLGDAKKAYDAKDYNSSAKLYTQYAKQTNNSQAYYDAGNSLYNQGKYKKAIDSYMKAGFDDKNSKAANLANLGNAHAKLQTQDELQKAIKSYEESLKLKDDKDVKENLEMVKKLLKQKQDNKQNKKDDKNKDSNKDKSSDKKDSKSKQDKKDNNSSQNKDNKSSDKKDSKSKQDKKNKSDKENQEKDKKQDKDKSDLKQLNKEDKKSSTDNTAQQQAQPQKMSDAEEKKWMKKLDTKNSSFMYMLGKENPKKEDNNEMPW